MAHIAHLVSSLQTGGAEKFVYNLARQQCAAGEAVAIVSFGDPDDHFQQLLAGSQIPVQNIHGSLPSRLAQLLALREFDVLHIHSPAVIRALTPLAPLLVFSRVIYTIHGEVDPPQSALKSSHQIARLYLDTITAVSEAARSSVSQRYGWSADMVRVIANGVWVPPRSPAEGSNAACPQGEPGNTIRLGTVSRLIPLKNIALLFEALSLLEPEERARFSVQVYGDGPSRAALESAAAQVDGCHIQLLGSVQDEAQIYGSIDMLVNCSDTEGLPMSIIEAMSYAKPVIATQVGAVPTVVEDGISGWLYTPGNANGLAAILAGLTTAADSATLGDRGRAIVEERFSIAAVARQFHALYGQEDPSAS